MDYFLTLHRWHNIPLFDISRRHRAISIRDQMIRGLTLAGRLSTWLETQPAGVTDRLLVVGAGAAGVSTAMDLARRGHPVDLVDQYAIPFRLQVYGRSRWIDPTQYDWPFDHWRHGRFPLGPPYERSRGVPLRWSSQRGDVIVRRFWSSRLAHAARRFGGRLNLRLRTEALIDPHHLKPIVAAGSGKAGGMRAVRGLEVGLRQQPGGNVIRRHYRVVIIAGGFGTERVSFGVHYRGQQDPQAHFFGYPFWAEDDLERLGREERVLISGSGDGALQDLLRVATGVPSAREFLDRISFDPPADLLQRIHSVEHRFERTQAWKAEGESLDEHLARLHQCFEQAAAPLVTDKVLKGVKQLARSRPRWIRLVNSHAFFTCHYPLNRLVALLLCEALPQRIRVVSNAKLKEVHWAHRSALPVELRQSPDDLDLIEQARLATRCRTYRWHVVTETADGQRRRAKDVTVLIIRHGLTDTKLKPLQQRALPRGPEPEPAMYVP